MSPGLNPFDRRREEEERRRKEEEERKRKSDPWSALEDLASDQSLFRTEPEEEKKPDPWTELEKVAGDPSLFDDSFDPEGEGYDYDTARRSGLSPDESGHWPSRDPSTGQLLKGARHPTWDKTIEAEERLGNRVTRGEGGRYFSHEDDWRSAALDPAEIDTSSVERGPWGNALGVLGDAVKTSVSRGGRSFAAGTLADLPSNVLRAAEFVEDIDPAAVIRRKAIERVAPGFAELEDRAREKGFSLLDEFGKKIGPEGPPVNKWAGLGELGARSLPTSIGLIRAFKLAPAFGTALAWGMEGSGIERSAEELGASKPLSKTLGLIGGGLAAAVETAASTLQLGKLANRVGVKPAMREILNTVLAEPTEEVVQEGIAIASEAIAAQDEESRSRVWQSAQDRMTQAFAVGALTGPLVRGGAVAGQMIERRREMSRLKKKADAEVREEARRLRDAPEKLPEFAPLPEDREGIEWAAEEGTEIAYRGDIRLGLEGAPGSSLLSPEEIERGQNQVEAGRRILGQLEEEGRVEEAADLRSRLEAIERKVSARGDADVLHLSLSPRTASGYSMRLDESGKGDARTLREGLAPRVTRFAVKGNLLDLGTRVEEKADEGALGGLSLEKSFIGDIREPLIEAGLTREDLAEINAAFSEAGRQDQSAPEGRRTAETFTLDAESGETVQEVPSFDMDSRHTYELFSDQALPIVKRKLQDLGYDGVRYREGNQDNLVVFDRTKSARKVPFGYTPSELAAPRTSEIREPEDEPSAAEIKPVETGVPLSEQKSKAAREVRPLGDDGIEIVTSAGATQVRVPGMNPDQIAENLGETITDHPVPGGPPGGSPPKPPRGAITSNEQGEIERWQGLNIGKRPEVPTRSLWQRAVRAADRAFQAAFETTQPITSRAARAGFAPEVVTNLDHLVEKAIKARKRAEKSISAGTRVYANTSGPVREAWKAIGEILPQGKEGHDIPTGEPLGKIFESMRKLGLDELDFITYMLNRRHVEVGEDVLSGSRTDVKVDPEKVDQSRRLVTLLERKYGPVEIQNIADRYTNWYRKAYLDPLVEAGFMSPETYAKFYHRGRKYWSFQRIYDFVRDTELEALGKTPRKKKGGSSPPRPLKLHKGVTEGAKFDPDALRDMITKAVQAQAFVERQRVLNQMGHLTDVARAADEADSESEADPNTQFPSVDPPGQVSRIRRFFGLDMPFDDFQGPHPLSMKGAADTYTVWRNGQELVYSAPVEVIKAFSTMGRGMTDVVMNSLGNVAAIQRAGATLDPTFALKQFLLDPLQSWINRPSGKVTDLIPNPFAASQAIARGDKKDALLELAGPLYPWVSTGVGIYDLITGSQHAEEAAAGGVGESLLVGIDLNDPDYLADLKKLRTTKEGAAAARFVERWRSDVGGVPWWWKVPEGILSPLRLITGGADMGTRVAAYSEGIKRGQTPDQADRQAGESSLPFHRGGWLTKYLNRGVPFFNVSFLDPVVLGRAIKRAPTRTASKLAVTVTLPSLAHWAMWHDDEDYQNLAEWKKMVFYHFGKTKDKLGGFLKDGWIVYPRVRGWTNIVFGYGIEKLADIASKSDPQAAEKIWKAITEDSFLQHFTGPYPGATTLPTAARVPLEAFLNKKLGWQAGRPVVPRRLEGASDPSLQVTEKEGPFYRMIGEALNVSPLVVKHVWEGTGASLGRYVSVMMDYAIDRAAQEAGADMGEGKPVTERPWYSRATQKPLSPGRAPLLKNFFREQDYGWGSAPVERIYEIRNKAEEQHKTARLRLGLQNQKMEPRDLNQAYMQDPKGLDLLPHYYSVIKKWEKQEKKLREELAQAQESAYQNPDMWDQVDEIEKRRTNTAVIYLRMMKDQWYPSEMSGARARRSS